MAGNPNPIFSKKGAIQGGVLIQNAANEWTGQTANNFIVFQADTENGSFLQRLRFKASGNNVATVARIYINEGKPGIAATISAPSGTPTGTPSASGGDMQTGTYFARIQAIDQYLAGSALSTESASVAVTSNTGSIVWRWSPVIGAINYRVFVGPATNQQIYVFETGANTNVYTQTTATLNTTTNLPFHAQPQDYLNINYLYGEISLPATVTSSTAATVDIDYPMNMALPPKYHILVGLGTAVANGWYVTAIGGDY